MTAVPEHVRAAFHAESGDATPLGYAWDYGFRIGNIVLSPALDPDNAAWSAKVRENLHVEGLRVVKPVRATDGRFVVSGWRANSYAAGELASGRVDEVVIAGLRLADALADVPSPEFATKPVTGKWKSHEIYRVADQAAWSDDPAQLLALGLDTSAVAGAQLEAALRLAARISPLLPPIEGPSHVGHADMLTTTLFSGTQPPLVTDIVATVRPHGYTAALAAVDGLLFDAVDSDIVHRFSHVPEFTGLLLRALLYRIFVSALSDEVEGVSERLERVANLLTGK
ncbi:TIGR02569 family protein [Corynebacterium hindlerae]|uniref:TIGR02569 family protein n=1 Tax=Corynebacterium hindlerae TaxID=699041 RepID=UPI001AD66CBC|nr:TIGR02569 family protein [Corynebacterium hindlerae]QTH60432.1 TIGR02569 family protein [Corynebacterium hindlerae]